MPAKNKEHIEMKRESGILLSIASLPSRYGIGCFSKEAYEFVDRLKEAGQSYWQILPLGPTSYGDSPYQSFSTFAGNPYFISLEDLIQEGVLTEEECSRADFGSRPDSVDYAKVYEERFPLLRKAYERSSISLDPEFRKFMEENRWWLEDYSLFMAVKARFGQTAWTQWAQDIRLRWKNALDYYRRELHRIPPIPSVQIQPAVEKTKILCQCQRNPHHRGHSHLCCHGQRRHMGPSRTL